MITSEHIETARKFLLDADREFEQGDILQASEKLWGAASHVVLAEMRQRGIAPSGHKATINAVEQIAYDYEEPSLRSLFTSAEMLHANFYHGFLDIDRFLEHRNLTRQFVETMLALNT